jgi:hypothetical protein
MSARDEVQRRAETRLDYALRAIERDHAEHRDVAAPRSDRPATAPLSTDFSRLPNQSDRPGWAPDR